MCMYIKLGPAEIHTLTQQKLVGRSMTVPPPVLSPSSILTPHSSQCSFSTARKKFVHFSKIFFQCFASLKTCVYLKLRTMKLRVMVCLCTSYNFRNNRMQKYSGPTGEDHKFLQPADARLAANTVSCHIRSQCEVSLQ
jgi:hypothetical protein